MPVPDADRKWGATSIGVRSACCAGRGFSKCQAAVPPPRSAVLHGLMEPRSRRARRRVSVRAPGRSLLSIRSLRPFGGESGLGRLHNLESAV